MLNTEAITPRPTRAAPNEGAGLLPGSTLPARATRIATAIATGRIRAGGIDLVDLDRLHRAVRRSGAPLVERVLTPAERDLLGHAAGATDPAPGFVGAFAAVFGVKEGVIKTVGGLPPGAAFHDIEVHAVPQPGAAPVAVEVHGALAEWAQRRRVRLWAACEQLSESMYLTWAVATPAGFDPTGSPASPKATR